MELPPIKEVDEEEDVTVEEEGEDLEADAVGSITAPDGRVIPRVSRGKAIRLMCVACMGGSFGEVRRCTATSCKLWPFRLGENPFRKKRVSSEAQVEHAKNLHLSRRPRAKPDEQEGA